MSEDRQKIISQIEKLLAVARDQATSEDVAMLYAEKAHELLAKHNLSLSELSKAADPIIHDNDLLTYYASWIKSLMGNIARLYFCGYFFEHFPTDFLKKVNLSKNDLRKLKSGWGHKTFLRHNFIGEQANIIIAKNLAEYLISVMERLCKEGETTVPTAERAAYRNTFMNACSARLCFRLYERRKNTTEAATNTNGTTLPALRSLYEQAADKYNEWVKQNGLKMRQYRNLGKLTHAKGSRDGHNAGDKIGLDQQVSGRHNHRLVH